jgi:hypothetical protein
MPNLTPEEKRNLIGFNKTKPSYKMGGALSSLYPTKKKGCGCKK